MRLSENRIRFLITAATLIVVSIFAFRQPALRSIPTNSKKADFTFDNLSIKSFNGAILESEITAENAEIYKKALYLSISNPSAKIAPKTNQEIEISAKKGSIFFLFNRFKFDNASVSLNFSKQPTTIKASEVEYHPKTNLIFGQGSVEVSNPLYLLKGKQFEIDATRRYLKVNSKVSGTIKGDPKK